MARDVVVFFDNLYRVVYVVLIAFDAQAAFVQVRTDMQRVLEQAHVFIQRAEKRFNLSGNVNSTSHSGGGASCGGNGLADGRFLSRETSNSLAQQSAAVKLQNGYTEFRGFRRSTC